MPTIRVRRPADFVEFRNEAILQGIHGLIEDQTRLFPGHIALRAPHVAYTYADMNGLANSIAAEILSASGTELAQAAILQPNTPEIIISILASLKAHKAYVPLDPNFPKERLKMMVEDAQPVVLVTDDQHLALAEELAGPKVRVVNVSRIDRKADAPNPHVPCDPMDRAYILFTSGSTGRPKGIEFQHRFLLHHTRGLVNHLFFSPSDRVTWLHSSSFAASIVDVYCCLMAGGTLYPWDVKTQGFIGLADWLVREKVTTFQWIPSAFRQFLRTVPDDFIFRDIRMVIMASEPLTVREVELFRRHFTVGSHLVNQLGTSEAGNYRIYTVDHAIRIEGVNVPGGYSPSPDRRVLILDEERRSLPHGSVGEIGVQSHFMCGGYWRDEELTTSKFIRVGSDSAPVYLTGDLGKVEENDCLIHLGRKDFQVKIRGHRVELAEVDHALTAAPGVADAAAWVVKNQLGEEQLVGYLVLRPECFLDERAIARYLESRLPVYMLPTRYVTLDCLPSLPTGKTDRKSLPNPFENVRPGPEVSGMPSESIGQFVIGLFEELLQMRAVTLQMNFMEAGGDSLLIAVLLQRAHKRFAVRIAANEFLETPTPGHFIRLITTALNCGDAQSSTASALPVPSLDTARAEHSTVPHNLIIISAGGFGREVFSWASQAIAAGAPYRIKGFLDSRENALTGFCYEAEILDANKYQIRDGDVFIGAIGNPEDKIRYYRPIIEKGGRFVNVIHPSVVLGTNVRLGTGIVAGPYTALNSDTTIGDHVAIGTFVNVGHDAIVGDWCHLASHTGVNGRATVGNAVFVGSHACILPGVKVADSAVIGAGSVVVRNVAAGARVFGNPAARIDAV